MINFDHRSCVLKNVRLKKVILTADKFQLLKTNKYIKQEGVEIFSTYYFYVAKVVDSIV